MTSSAVGSTCSLTEQFKCDHGGDVIECCNVLAERGVSLYVIGLEPYRATQAVHKAQRPSEESMFFAGISHISGGQFIKLSKLKPLGNVSIDLLGKENM